jgi:PTS system mannose-specific IIA component
MIGIVVVAHSNIGCDPPQAIKQQITDAINAIDTSDGLLILTDMFGGTPSNICLSFLNREKTEVISGLNLPMLIKLANLREQVPFDDIVPFIQQYGQRNIVIASHVLAGHSKKVS